jgi:hypothetical protein
MVTLDVPQERGAEDPAPFAGLSLCSSVAVYSNTVVSLYRTRQEIPARLRTPWSGYVWERCKI